MMDTPAREGELPPMQEQGPHCYVCGCYLPCRDHPTPPKLSFVGGTHFYANPQYKRSFVGGTHFYANPQYKREEGPRPKPGVKAGQNGSGVDTERARADDHGWPARDSAVAASAGHGPTEARPQLLGDQVHGDVPLHVAAASERLSQSNNAQRGMSVSGALNVAMDMKLTNVLILSEAENGELIFVTTSETDLAQANWLCDRMKAILLTPDIDED